MISYQIIISNKAKQQIIDIYEFIKKDSLQNAQKVRNNILNSISSLNFMPQ